MPSKQKLTLSVKHTNLLISLFCIISDQIPSLFPFFFFIFKHRICIPDAPFRFYTKDTELTIVVALASEVCLRKNKTSTTKCYLEHWIQDLSRSGLMFSSLSYQGYPLIVDLFYFCTKSKFDLDHKTNRV